MAECFEPGKEIIVIRSAENVIGALTGYDIDERRRIGQAFHQRALRDHTYAQRAIQVEQAFAECLEQRISAASTSSREDYLVQERA